MFHLRVKHKEGFAEHIGSPAEDELSTKVSLNAELQRPSLVHAKPRHFKTAPGKRGLLVSNPGRCATVVLCIISALALLGWARTGLRAAAPRVGPLN